LSKLYALYDFELNKKNRKTVKEFVKICYDNGVEVIQYRDKINSHDSKKKILLELRSLWDRVLIVNDDIELALFCDGVHLGQDDFSMIAPTKSEALQILRQKLKQKIIGLSTHNKEEILEANSLDIDYIGLGAYRDTTTKKDIQGILGSDIEVLSKLSCKDVAIIGGVRVDDKIDFATYRVVGSDMYR